MAPISSILNPFNWLRVPAKRTHSNPANGSPADRNPYAPEAIFSHDDAPIPREVFGGWKASGIEVGEWLEEVEDATWAMQRLNQSVFYTGFQKETIRLLSTTLTAQNTKARTLGEIFPPPRLHFDARGNPKWHSFSTYAVCYHVAKGLWKVPGGVLSGFFATLIDRIWPAQK